MMNKGARERSRALVGDTWMLRNKAPGWVPCFVLVVGDVWVMVTAMLPKCFHGLLPGVSWRSLSYT